MQLLELEHIGKSFGPLEVLADVTFGVSRGERVAIVAPNGAGKTTLLRIVAGQLAPDTGRVTWARGAGSVGYLPQVIPPGRAPTAGDSLTAAAAAGHRPGEEDRIDEAGRIAEAVRRFGLPPACLEVGLDRLSGGERTRCLLAGLWLQAADFLLLDEPTNHLDMTGLRWLERWVAGYRGTVLMVSHDRVFLDRAATRVIALANGRAKSYPGNYSYYRQARAAEIESQMQQYRAEECRVAALRAAVIRQADWAARSHKNAASRGDKGEKVYYRNKAEKIAQRGKALSSQLARLEAAQADAPRQAPSFQMRLQHADKTGRFVLRVEGVGKSFDRPLLSNITFAVGRGEKVGLVGPNGSGKTTLLRIIAGQLPADSGRVYQLPGSGATYLDQHASSLRDDLTPYDEISRLVGQPAAARTLLGSFLFDEHRALAAIATLSPGERSRLALLIMLLSPSNLLLLDEPTNHLDLSSREQVETALATYSGAILLVSHDRYLLQTLCSRIVALEGHGMRSFPGGYAEYEASAGPAESGQAPERVVLTDRRQPRGVDEARILLENRLAVLSGELARLSKDDAAYAATVEEFLATARQLRH